MVRQFAQSHFLIAWCRI